MTCCTALEHCWDVLCWVLDVFCANDTTEENVFWCVVHAWRHTTRTVYEVDALHECDVLPHFGLTRNRCDCADLLVAECVDDGGLASVGIANKTDGDLLACRVKGRELTE
jgi:hypothetical protein